MHALVDCDIFCYEFGHARQEDGTPLDWNLVVWRIDSRLAQILEATQAETWEGFLTGEGNFRDQVATILPYKGKRNRQERPFWYRDIYNYLSEYYPVTVVVGKEADDEIADRHSKESTIICSRDKDFRQLEGWHYSWPGYKQEEKSTYYIDFISGRRFLYYQLLVGDTADNILGLYGVGDKSTLVTALQTMDTEEELRSHVLDQYTKRFGNYGSQFFEENMKLLKLGSN